jgi:V8-like Glu-specific endopeptidase
MTQRFLKSLTHLGFTLFLLIISSSFIVIRDDKTDTEYIALGKSHPYVCKVGQNAGDGTLINSQWIITAGHVAAGMQAKHGKNFRIIFEGIQEEYSIEQIYIHPDFRPMGEHDIALIKLNQPINTIPYASLYRKNNEKGKEIIIVGHGDFKTGKEKKWHTDGKRRAATNRIDDITSTQIIYSFDKPTSSGVTELEGTAGRGDSGGPALIKEGKNHFVAGISSAGMPGEHGPGTYGAIEYYTRVSSHLAWIDEVLAEKVQSTNTEVATDTDPPVLNGLGLILEQEGDRIAIHGKIDPEVPKEFRDVIFGNGSFVVSLNGKTFTSLNMFKDAFMALKKGTKYDIEFNVKGEIRKFNVIR